MRELAEKIGSYPMRISRFENGKATPRPDELKKLREVLLDGQTTQTA
jgi:ribosome-binding protein aMBF1 (putative translation factor)